MPPGQFAHGCCRWVSGSAGCECKAAPTLRETPSGCSLYIPTLHLRDLNNQHRRLFSPWAFTLHLSQRLPKVLLCGTAELRLCLEPLLCSLTAPHSERAVSEPSRAKGEAGTRAGVGEHGWGFLRVPAPTPSSSAAAQGGENWFSVHL